MDERPVSLESAAADAVEFFKGLRERVVRMRETLDRSVPREVMERQCARLQRQIDESHAALRRRNARMAEISTERDELRAKVDSMRKRLMPEGMEWLIEAWPKFEDDAPVKLGDTALIDGDADMVEAVQIWIHGKPVIYGDNGSQQLEKGERVKRPEPKVLAADGEPLEVGQTVFGTRDLEPVEVVSLNSKEYDGVRTVKCKDRTGSVFYSPDDLTHRRPVLDADGVPIREGDTVWDVDGSGPYEVSSIDGSLVNMASGACINRCYLIHEQPDTWERLYLDIDNGRMRLDEFVRRCRALAERGE